MEGGKFTFLINFRNLHENEESRTQIGITNYSELDEDFEGDYTQNPENIRVASVSNERNLKFDSINQIRVQNKPRVYKNKPQEKFFKGASAVKEEKKGK